MKASQIWLGLLASVFAFAAQADPIEQDTIYGLWDHPAGNAAPPSYGLRLDGLTTGRARDIFTFEFEHTPDDGMYLFWDSVSNDLYIFGVVYGGENDRKGGYKSSDFWYVDFIYEDLYSCYGGGLCSDWGYGFIESDNDGSYDLYSVSGRNDYDFQLNDNHRGFDGISGWGWMNHCPSYGNDGRGGSCNEHLYSSDWLFTVKEVPEPGTLALLGIGLLGMGLSRRRKV